MSCVACIWAKGLDASPTNGHLFGAACQWSESLAAFLTATLARKVNVLVEALPFERLISSGSNKVSYHRDQVDHANVPPASAGLLGG